MLELRPICEHCAKLLPPASEDAMICSYECTFCRDCVENILGNVCPNCGGGFEPRPMRPRTAWRPATSVIDDPPTETRKHKPVDALAHGEFVQRIKHLPPAAR